ncbi:IncF plasmid conjugative transfer pilus assembly protein TraC [Spiroplasma endosymbiont of Danaus chrysippus]|nr:IncF plasmid conjugative transfer pilus assembly protein TraC [Spiroplasma endosymbiont of Danaus chrysippus]
MFLITSILIAYLLPILILKWITTTITFLLGCLSLVKNSNETRVYNTIFNAIKYSTKLLVNRKVIVKPHYVNTSSVEVLQFNYKKESLFLSGIQLQSTNLQLLNIEQQKVILDDFSSLLKVINLPCKLIKIDNNYDFENQINNLTNQLKKANKVNKQFINLQIKQLKLLNDSHDLKTPVVYLLWFAKSIFEAKNQLQLVNETLAFSNLKFANLNNEQIINCWQKFSFEGYEFACLSNSIKENFMNKKGFIWSLTNLPNKISPFWLSQLFSVENCNLVVNIYPVTKKDAKKRIDEAINKIKTNTSNYAKTESQRIENKNYEEAFLNEQQSILDDTDILKEISIFILCVSNNKKIISNSKKELKNLAINKNWKYDKLSFLQAEAIISSYFIYNLLEKSCVIDMTCDTFATSFPIPDMPLSDEKGFLLAETVLAKPVIWDLFKKTKERVNKNLLIFGESGSGKSFTAKKILLNQAYQNAKIFVLDPENEFKTLVTNLNGQMINASGSLGNVINPLEIIKLNDDEEDNADSFNNQLSLLEAFFITLFPKLNDDDTIMNSLIEIVKETYKNKKILPSTNFIKLENHYFSTFNDALELIKQKLKISNNKQQQFILENLKSKLTSLTQGTYAKYWNGHTKFQWNEKNIVCFNLIELLENNNKKIINIQMMLILQLLGKEMINIKTYNEQNLSKNQQRIIIVVDEAHLLANENNPIALDFLFHSMKRIRKYNGSLIIITQNINDFSGNETIKKKFTGILNSAQYWLIGGLQPEDLNALNQMYQQSRGLSDAVKNYLSKANQGKFWFKISKQEQLPIQVLQIDDETKIVGNT